MRAFILLLAFGLVLPATAFAQSTRSGDATGITDAPFQRDLELTCRFAIECLEDEPCAETEFEAALTGKAGGLTPDALAAVAKFSSVAGDVEMLGVARKDGVSVVGGPVDARHMLTLSGAAARYSVHYLEGPMAITYLGTCQ